MRRGLMTDATWAHFHICPACCRPSENPCYAPFCPEEYGGVCCLALDDETPNRSIHESRVALYTATAILREWILATTGRSAALLIRAQAAIDTACEILETIPRDIGESE
jgi:hypothetical protein